MKRSSAVKKPRGKGVRFVKGDLRINRKGPLKAELQGYEIRMRNAAPSKLGPEEFIGIVADEVRHHRPGSREFWGKYIVGEPAAKHELELKTRDPLLIKVVFVRDDGKPGNSDGGNGDKAK